MTRRIIRADGTEEALPQPVGIVALSNLIGADTVDTVSLRHLGHPLQVMLVDDAGHQLRRPVNAKATALYHANCKPGATHQIVGDVAVVFDNDFGGPHG